MNPWTDLPQILIGELGRPTGIFIASFNNSKLRGLNFVGKTEGKAGFSC